MCLWEIQDLWHWAVLLRPRLYAQMPIFIVIVGLIYLVEVLSVMIQVTYFKRQVEENFQNGSDSSSFLNYVAGQKQESSLYFPLLQHFCA